ncbi:leucine-rich repeat domain-containing protein [Dyadobacter sp. BHUBP1]|uniref:leucine-rich repeat domain-containing protein n=1 Tax=Dyadobacter sp. BHUBP1 TaxID=3424178 RepID=UPI003D336A24
MKGCLLGLVCLFASVYSFGQTLESDRLALVAFYQATGGNNWHDNTGWTVPGSPGDNPCGWRGVTCENERVTSLILEEEDIVAPIPAAVGNLTALKHLDLSGPGGEILYFYGDLPVELGNLTNLEYLDLSGNQLTGVNVSVINNLTKLKHLSLTPYPNWPVLPSLANLINLEYLRLAVEDAAMQAEGSVGAIPAYIGNFTRLKTLIMRHGGVTGTIPSSLGGLTDLEVLDLSENQLTGAIPASFNNLTKLTKLDLSNNNLNGPVPNILGIPIEADVRINNNAFTFSGMETNISRLDSYGNQEKFKLTAIVPLRTANNLRTTRALGGMLIADFAGGTAANNTYKWYKSGVLVATTVGIQYFSTADGIYRAEVTNSLVSGLTMVSEEFVLVGMPVTLISFDGKSENNQTKLTWKTSAETNNQGFEIERSADARSFAKIGFVDGNGDTKEVNTYHFTDVSPLVRGFYRLKQLDYDGKFEYSKIIEVKGDAPMVKVYPNPAEEYLTISGSTQKLPFSIVDQNGRVVLKGLATDKDQIDVRKLGAGSYVVKVDEEVSRLLIVR